MPAGTAPGEEELEHAWRVGASAAAFRTTLLWSDGSRSSLEMLAATATVDRRLTSRWTLVVGGGPVLWGRLGEADGVFAVGAGAAASAAISSMVLEPRGAVPFVLLGGSVSVSQVATGAGPWSSLDARFSASAGWTLWQRFSPYVTARAFGGPVFWRGKVGTDAWHFQLGAGAVLGLPGGFDVSAEVIPLGEQRVSVGLGLTL